MSEEQTFSTLRFASEAKKITNHAKVNEILDEQGQISRMRKEMEELKRELEAQKKINTNEMLEEMKESLEKERTEKEEKMREIEILQMKVITSSQPAPPRKSMMVQSRGNRRETWCGPNLKKAMRRSFAPAAFTRPLPDLSLELPPPATSATPSFEFTPSTFEKHLEFQESEKLSEMDENETSWLKLTPSPVVRKKRKTVNFVQSPQFLSPKVFRNPRLELSSTEDGATPKAVIRDKFKRVSLALSDREQELERERQERLETEAELNELREFTRLEDESGVYHDMKSKVDEVCDDQRMEKLMFLEKSVLDSEKMILDMRKDLEEKKKENVTLSSRLQEAEDSLGKETETRQMLTLKVNQLEPLLSEVKVLREKSDLLERNKEDFDMEMELALKKKETIISDLKAFLESAYEEIASNESSSKDEVKKRYAKKEDLQKETDNLKEELKAKEDLLAEQKKVIEDLTKLQDQAAAQPEGKSLFEDEEIKRLKEIEKSFSEEKEKVLDLQKKLEVKTNYHEELQKIQNSLVQEKEEALAKIEEKNLAIEDLKLCIEDQTKEHEDVLMEAGAWRKEAEEARLCFEEQKEKIKTLSNDFAKTEGDLLVKVASIEEESSALKLDLENSCKAKEALSVENQDLLQRVSTLSLKIEDSAKDVSEKIGAMEELEEKNSQLREEIENVKLSALSAGENHAQKYQEIETKLASVCQEKVELHQQVVTLTSELEAESKLKEDLNEKLKESESAERNAEDVQCLLQKIQVLENLSSEAERCQEAQKVENAEMLARISALIQEKEEAVVEISTLKESLKGEEVQRVQNLEMIKTLSHDNTKSDEALRDLLVKVTSLEEESSALKLDLENSYKVKEALSVENQDLLERIATLSLEIEDSTKEKTGAMKDLEERNSQLREEIENVKLSALSAGENHAQKYQEIETKLASVCQEKVELHQQVVTLTSVLEAESKLKEDLNEKIKELELETVRKDDKLSDVQCLLQKIQVLENQSSEAQIIVSEKDSAVKCLMSTNEEQRKEIENIQFLLQEAEKQRDLVDEAADKIEAELELTKEKLKKVENSFEEKESQVKEFQSKSEKQGEEIENLKFFLEEVKTQNDEANEACDKAEEALEVKNGEVKSLQKTIGSLEAKLAQVQLAQTSSVQEQQIEDLKNSLSEVRKELGQRNIDLASIQVDVERGELEYKKKCEVLQVIKIFVKT